MPVKKKKDRILLLLRMLYEHSDQDHPLTTPEIIQFFDEQGITIERHSVRHDIASLEDAGFDVVTVKSDTNRYFMGSREFELPELKLLIDAVAASQIISQSKTQVLLTKLMRLASSGQQQLLRTNLAMDADLKPDNESIYYVIDAINEAINSHKKITFQYMEYGPDKMITLRHGGEWYVFSPWALIWSDDRYYMIGWSQKYDKVTVFRVDRMCLPRILDEKAVCAPADFSAQKAAKEMFTMFGGRLETVRLQCANELMKVIVDRFGKDVKTKRDSDSTFIVEAQVVISPPFFGWIFQFGGKIRILSPDDVVSEYQDLLAAGSHDRV